MRAFDGEILTLRPEGFKPDTAAIETYIKGLPGLYRHSDKSPWALVAPPSDLPRLSADPIPETTRPGDPQFVLVSIADDEIWIHPGLTTLTWARAQHVIRWLLGLGAWRVSGQDRELGVVRSESELFDHLYIPTLDPNNPTESPPSLGELTTFRRYLGDVDANHYFHMFVRVHDSGAFSCELKSEVDDLRWQARLTSDLAPRWSTLVSQLDFSQASPGGEGDFEDRVAVIVERPGATRKKTLDAAHPPESFASLVRLMDGWAQDLLDEKRAYRPPQDRNVVGAAGRTDFVNALTKNAHDVTTTTQWSQASRLASGRLSTTLGLRREGNMRQILTMLSVATTVAACHNGTAVQCEVNSNCNLTSGGVCSSAASGNQWCSYGDPSCPSGLRYADDDVGDGLAGTCVAGGIDAGIDGAAPADGDTTCKVRVVFVDGKPPFSGQDDSSGQREVWAANPDGSGLVNLSNNATADDAHPSWSPNGLKVAFASNRSNSAGHYQIFVVNVDGTGLTNLTPSLSGASRPSWSPDGTRIAFTLSGNIWTMNADGTGAAQLTTLSVGTVASIVGWSPDSKQLLYDQSPLNGIITNTLYVVSIGTGSQPVKLNTGNAQEIAGVWAPFQRIALDNRLNVFTINSDGSGIVNVTQSTDASVGIIGAVTTNNGNTIVFSRSRADDSGHFDLWSILSAGGTPAHITDTKGTRSSDHALSASSDGSMISVFRITDTIQGTNVVVTSQIGTVGLDGTGLHLFNAPGGSNANEVRLSTAVCL